MDSGGDAGVIVERGKKVYVGQAKLHLVPINWKKLRRIVAWPMILVFATGSLALWWGAINSLVLTGGFAGIVSWQILGFFLPVYQGHKIYGRIAARKESGAFMVGHEMRQRLWAIVTIIILNAAANLVAVVLVLWNLGSGRLEWTWWDSATFMLAGMIVLVLALWKRRQVLKNQTSLFFVATSTRMLPQMALAFSIDLRTIPWLALGGVGAIAVQRFLVSSIELAEVKSEHAARDGLAAARWVWRGDVGNLMAIAVPIVAKLLS